MIPPARETRHGLADADARWVATDGAPLLWVHVRPDAVPRGHHAGAPPWVAALVAALREDDRPAGRLLLSWPTEVGARTALPPADTPRCCLVEVDAATPAWRPSSAHPSLPDGAAALPLDGWIGADLVVHRFGERSGWQTLPHPAPPPRGPRRGALALVAALAAAGLAWRAVPGDGARAAVHASPTGALGEVRVAGRCEADDPAFVQELRCQVRALAARGEGWQPVPVCADPGGEPPADDPGEDLQATWCGLSDRRLDGGRSDTIAVTHACFNVLGHPARLARTDPEGRVTADPEGLGALPAVQAHLGDLRAACDRRRLALERRVEGAVFATHLGAALPAERRRDLPEGAALLRADLLTAALERETTEAVACFRDGVDLGPLVPSYDLACPSAPHNPDADGPLWRALGGAPRADAGPLPDRYLAARSPDAPPEQGLWRCHADLRSGDDPDRAAGAWDLVVPAPRRYAADGAVRDQLTLDAWLREVANGAAPSACWQVVLARLGTWRPVHPLLGATSPLAWVSEEQQVCGQVCAAYFQLRRPAAAGRWRTRDQDLDRCVMRVPGPAYDLGEGILDRLRLPWNEVGRGEWIEPSTAQVCAFNLLAQGLLPTREGDAGPPAREVAGEVVQGSRIAGGEDGLAARYVSEVSLGRTGRTGCGVVAEQCFTARLLEALDEAAREGVDAHRSLGWRMEELATLRLRELAELDPWCAAVQPYLGDLTGTIDAPCAAGVADARARTTWRLDQLLAIGAEGPW